MQPLEALFMERGGVTFQIQNWKAAQSKKAECWELEQAGTEGKCVNKLRQVGKYPPWKQRLTKVFGDRALLAYMV